MEKYGFLYTSKDAMILYEHFSTNLGFNFGLGFGVFFGCLGFLFLVLK